MSLRRSARNVAQPAVSKVSGAPKENGIATHATSVIDANGNGVRDAEYPAPSPELQAKRGARKIGTAMVDTKVTKKKTVTPKKTSAPVKRKAPVTESEASTGIITNVANSRETPASTGAPPELINQIQPETPASIDVANPIETFTIPNDTLTDADFAAPGTQHGRVPTPDMPRGAEEGLSLPSTPVSKKRRKTKTDGVSPAKTVPFTPTPSGVGLIAGPENIARKPKNRAKTKNADHMLDSLASINRPAAPDVTNAPVLTSNGSQVVINDSPARKRKAADLPPDVGSPHKPANSTTETLLKDAEAYLVKVDETEKLAKLIENQRCKLFSPKGLSEAVDPFTALASGIMGQQVSGAAAASIRKKFTALFSDTHPAFPSPSTVLTKDIPTLRTAGLSQRKAEYITGLAEKFASGEFTAEGLVSASDEELIEKLVAVRGLGRWSVEMFACFGLKRMDVFSTGDLGVQRGMAAYMGRDVSKLKNKGGKWKYMSEQEMLSIASKFSPYRSLFMWYMWRIADVETEVLE